MLHGRLVWLEWGRGLKVGLDSIRSENLALDLQFEDQDLDLLWYTYLIVYRPTVSNVRF